MTTEMTRSLRALHDRLMEEKPEGAVHEPESCPFCAMEELPHGGDDMTYTEDELKAKVDEAVQAAVEERDAKIASLESDAQTSETAKAVADAIATKDSEIEELRGELDKAVLSAANVTAERDAIVSWLDGEKTAGEEREAIASRKDSRVAKLKEVAAFPDSYLEQNAERFAAMSDEEFEARCAEYAALSGERANGEIPSGMPSLSAALEGPGSTRRGPSAVKELLALRRESRGVVDLSNL